MIHLSAAADFANVDVSKDVDNGPTGEVDSVMILCTNVIAAIHPAECMCRHVLLLQLTLIV